MGLYEQKLSALRIRADRNRRNPELLKGLLRQAKAAAGNPLIDPDEARRVYQHIERVLRQCRSGSSQEMPATTS